MEGDAVACIPMWNFVKEVFKEFMKDQAISRAAAVAFYAALSLAPMVLLFVAITGYLGEDTQQRMFDTVTRTVGPDAGDAVRTIAAQGQDRVKGAGLSLVVSIAVILFSASSVFAALQVGLNYIWDVRVAPGSGAKSWIRKRLLSMGMVLTIGFLMLISMVATTVVGMVVPSNGWIWSVLNLLVSFGLLVLLFAGIYRFLPDVEIAWKQVWVGALITAGLFTLGQLLVGLYISRAGYRGSYGAAGSMVAVLVWVYYSAIIVFLGAEITQVYARRSGNEITPDKHAVRVHEVMEGAG